MVGGPGRTGLGWTVLFFSPVLKATGHYHGAGRGRSGVTPVEAGGHYSVSQVYRIGVHGVAQQVDVSKGPSPTGVTLGPHTGPPSPANMLMSPTGALGTGLFVLGVTPPCVEVIGFWGGRCNMARKGGGLGQPLLYPPTPLWLGLRGSGGRCIPKCPGQALLQGLPWSCPRKAPLRGGCIALS